jgi:hypothetical protein
LFVVQSQNSPSLIIDKSWRQRWEKSKIGKHKIDRTVYTHERIERILPFTPQFSIASKLIAHASQHDLARDVPRGGFDCARSATLASGKLTAAP